MSVRHILYFNTFIELPYQVTSGGNLRECKKTHQQTTNYVSIPGFPTLCSSQRETAHYGYGLPFPRMVR